MKRLTIRSFFLAAAVGLAGVGLVLSMSAREPDAGTGTRDALQRQRANLEAAISRSDAAATAALFAVDARLMVAEFAAIEGRDAIRRVWEQVLGSKAVTRLVLTPQQFDGLAGEFPVETGRLVTYDADGKEGAPSHYLIVWKQEDGAWKILRDIVSPQSAPAPAVDRVGFPRDYRTQLQMVAPPVFNPKLGLVQTAYGNEPATHALAAARLPYPHGSVFVMEFARVVRDGDGNPARDADGRVQRGPVIRVDVMRRGAGWGEAYGRNRAGEWEFVSYKEDGSFFTPPAATASCAACHRNQAGEAKDFVFSTMNPGHP